MRRTRLGPSGEDEAQEGPLMDGLTSWLGPSSAAYATLLAMKPVPVLVVDSQTTPEGFWDELEVRLAKAMRGLPWCRCASVDRLPVILATGCDVEPPDSVFWAAMGTQKALEYGGDEKVMMCFDRKALESSWREVPADTDPAELAGLGERFPTKQVSEDGRWFWFSRLPSARAGAATPYEGSYGYWIPGDPFAALKMLVVIGRDFQGLVGRVRAALAACEDPQWE